MRAFVATSFCAVVLALATQSRASIIFSDDFESGTLANWTTVSAATALAVSQNQNKVPAGGVFSAVLDISTDGMYHNLGLELSGPSTLSSWIYDDTATRAWVEARAYTGAGWGDGTLANIAAAGRYVSVNYPGDTFDPTKYQGRVFLTDGTTPWFNLNGPGAPSRSTGWHLFTIERTADGGTMNFYVDGILSRTIAGVSTATWDTIAMTSVRAGSTLGNAYYDGVEVTNTLVPEPATFGLLGLCAVGLLARRRK